jgi:hypothetical protein
MSNLVADAIGSLITIGVGFVMSTPYFMFSGSGAGSRRAGSAASG